MMNTLNDRVKSLQRRVLFFALPALVIAFLVGVLIVQKQNLLAPKIKLFVSPPTATGIVPGLPVTLKGLRIGEVDQVSIEGGSLGETKVKVSFLVLTEYVPLIPHNSEVRLTKEGFIGQANLEIFPGPSGNRPVANKETLSFASSPGLSDILEEVRPVVAEAGTLLKSFNSENGKFQQALGNSNQLLLDLTEGSKSLKDTLETTSQSVRSIGGEVASTMQTTRDTLISVDHTVGNMAEQSHATLATTQEQITHVGTAASEALAHTQQAADAAKETVQATHDVIGKTGERADRMMSEADGLVRDASEIVSGAKRAWPIRNWVAPPERKQLPIDSGEYVNAQP